MEGRLSRRAGLRGNCPPKTAHAACAVS